MFDGRGQDRMVAVDRMSGLLLKKGVAYGRS